jgi:hypothetical protein
MPARKPGVSSIGDTTVMASDGMCSGTASFQGFGLSIAAKSAAQAASLFAALGEGGQVRVPLGPTFFSPSFGMVADRFGVIWMVIAVWRNYRWVDVAQVTYFIWVSLATVLQLSITTINWGKP